MVISFQPLKKLFKNFTSLAYLPLTVSSYGYWILYIPVKKWKNKFALGFTRNIHLKWSDKAFVQKECISCAYIYGDILVYISVFKLKKTEKNSIFIMIFKRSNNIVNLFWIILVATQWVWGIVTLEITSVCGVDHHYQW